MFELIIKIFIVISFIIGIFVGTLIYIWMVSLWLMDKPIRFHKHIKGNPSLFRWRTSTITGEIDALYHCKKCFEIMHYPLSKNPEEKKRYDEWNKKQRRKKK